MFTIRRITSQNLESNQALGERYVLIDKEKNPEDFEKSLKAMKWTNEQASEVYAFVSYNSGKDIMPLYRKSTYFIMTGKGQTFANISFR